MIITMICEGGLYREPKAITMSLHRMIITPNCVDCPKREKCEYRAKEIDVPWWKIIEER